MKKNWMWAALCTTLILPSFVGANDAPRIQPISLIQEQGSEIANLWNGLVRHAMENGSHKTRKDDSSSSFLTRSREGWEIATLRVLGEKPKPYIPAPGEEPVLRPHTIETARVVYLQFKQRSPSGKDGLHGPTKLVNALRLRLTPAGHFLSGILQSPLAGPGKIRLSSKLIQYAADNRPGICVSQFVQMAIRSLGKGYNIK